ncbi:LemA-like protein [Bifidobacterium actinocoloniiforme DSM 22766]|uniref:LemA-like protein n=1 Tax=Bifidobacterium actinocoloniiforme DSM 22766 TaxID=1437605 RepID=A0A086YYK1_9BIFI|nr:LemA family protein [Bifidobacterium actinocoloniiforme]AKV55882.1 membrane protein [Bifidobacterium actinocoloniiforme DSM 22766]KFI39351.1 LemA-like protein [Bifidobacterium actinocoloniiforme DSM 22766]
MSTLTIILIVLLVLIVLVVLWAISAYNSLVGLRNRVKNGWSQIDVVLKQRSDLVPNLVETVKGYAGHESGTLTAVTQARAGTVQAAASAQDDSRSVATRAQAESRLSSALFNLMATAEAYPDLKANQNFLDLQSQLSALEQKIAYARQFYNDVTQKYDTRIQQVPSNIIASLFHFQEAQYFEAEPEARQVPKVDFSK